MAMLEVEWIKCESGSWCDFARVNLSHEHFNDLKGVYIIWNDEGVVRVGSGVIRDRIASHRENADITVYRNLKVTWAQVNANQMEGVEKYLADQCKPKVGERFPDRKPIEVNLP